MFRTFLAFLALCGVVMAVEQKPKPLKPQMREPTTEERYWQSEEGQDVDRLFNQLIEGKIEFDEAERRYRQRWGGQPVPPPHPQTLPKLNMR